MAKKDTNGKAMGCKVPKNEARLWGCRFGCVDVGRQQLAVQGEGVLFQQIHSTVGHKNAAQRVCVFSLYRER